MSDPLPFECSHCGAVRPVPCDDAPEQAHPSASAASPLCSCGKQAVEDGGTEGRCECCSGCERDAPLTHEARLRLLTPLEVTP